MLFLDDAEIGIGEDNGGSVDSIARLIVGDIRPSDPLDSIRIEIVFESELTLQAFLDLQCLPWRDIPRVKVEDPHELLFEILGLNVFQEFLESLHLFLLARFADDGGLLDHFLGSVYGGLGPYC